MLLCVHTCTCCVLVSSIDSSVLRQHVFVAQTGLTWRLAVDLLDKMNNPDNHQPYSEVDDDDLEVTPSL